MDGQDQQDPRALVRLLEERDALTRRVTGIDVELEKLYSARHEELSRRMALLEQSLSRLAAGAAPVTATAPAAVAAATIAPAALAVNASVRVPEAEPVAAQAVAAAVPATPAATPTPQGPPATQAPSQPHPAPSLQPGTPSRPTVVRELVAIDSVSLWAGHERGAAMLGWVPTGTRLLLTDERADERVQVVYQNRLAWADPHWLAPPEAWAPPAGPPAVTTTPPQHPGQSSAPGAQGAVAPAPARPAPPQAAAARSDAGLDLLHPDQRPPAQPPQPRAPQPEPAWRRPGFLSKVLALVGAGVTLIGVAFLLILAAQYGMFGPEARTISAAGLGVVLIGLAFFVRSRDVKNVGAPILAATGIAAGFLSVVTATVIYGWLPPLIGAALAGAIGLAGMVLARRWDNQWVGIVAVLGGLVLAAYIGGSQPVATAAMMVLLTGVTLWFERGTGWQLFPFARVLPTSFFVLTLTLDIFVDIPSPQVWALVMITVVLALLGLASALIAPDKPPVGQAIALTLLVPMVGPAALSPVLLNNSVDAASVLAFLAAVFVATGFLPSVHERVRWVAVPIGAGFVMLAVLTATQNHFWQVLTLALAAAYLGVAARSRSLVSFIVGGILGTIGGIAWLPLLARSFSASAASTAGLEQIAQSLAGVAVVVLGALATIRWVGQTQAWMLYVAWAAGTVVASVAVIHTGTWLGALSGNASGGFQTGHAVVTIAWMGLCVLFLQRGLATKEDADVWLHLALATASLAVAKLFLLDLGTLDAIARVGAFLVVGLLLLFVGTRYAKAWERAHGDEEDAPQAHE